MWRLAAVAFALSLPSPLAAQSTDTPLLIRDVTLIDGTGAAPRAHVSLVVRNGHLAAIVNVDQPVPATRDTIDARGLWAIPGLFDAHVHVGSGAPATEAAALAKSLRGGVTAVLNMAGDSRAVGGLQAALLDGYMEGPTIYGAALMAGPPFFTDPRVASVKGYPVGEHPSQQSVTDTTDLVRAIARARGTGADAIKIYASMSAALAARVTAEAHAQGMKVVAHGTVFPAKPGELVAAGVDLLTHAPYLAWEGSPATPDWKRRRFGDFAGVPANGPVITALLRTMKTHGTALNPTLWIFAEGQRGDSLEALRTAWMYAVTKRAADMGVPIVSGTDAMVLDSDSLPMLHRELELSVRGAGLSPMQAIVSATSAPAHLLGIEAERGSLQPGRRADLVLLAADPLADISNTRAIRYIVQGGRVVRRPPTVK